MLLATISRRLGNCMTSVLILRFGMLFMEGFSMEYGMKFEIAHSFLSHIDWKVILVLGRTRLCVSDVCPKLFEISRKWSWNLSIKHWERKIPVQTWNFPVPTLEFHCSVSSVLLGGLSFGHWHQVFGTLATPPMTLPGARFKHCWRTKIPHEWLG